MMLTLNGGRGALLCDQCRIIVMEDMTNFEWDALIKLNEKNHQWYCKDCKPHVQDEQYRKLVDEVNFRSKYYSKLKRERLHHQYEEF